MLSIKNTIFGSNTARSNSVQHPALENSILSVNSESDKRSRNYHSKCSAKVHLGRCVTIMIALKKITAVGVYTVWITILHQFKNINGKSINKVTPNKFPVSCPLPASFSGMSQNFPLLELLYVYNIHIYFCTRSVLASSER